MAIVEVMPKYEAYKDSGVGWIGDIPEHWSTHRFRYIFSFGKGLTITKENLHETGVPCVNYGEVHSKYRFELDLSKHTLKCVNEEYLETNPKSLLSIGDFVFADTSEDIEGSGNFTQLISGGMIFAGYHTVVARPVIGNNNRYIAYVLDSISYRNQIRNAVKGVKVFSITKTILKNTNVWFPTEIEQTAIANFLDKKNTQIDEAIAIKEKQIELLKERKQTIIQKAVTQGLNPNVPMKDSGVDWIGEIPEHWEVRNSKWMFDQRKEKSRRSDEQLTASQKYGVLPQKEFMNLEGRRVTQVEFNPEILKHVEANDFVISMRSFQGGIEYCPYVGCISSAYVPLVPKKTIYSPYYKYLLKCGRYIEALQSTSNLVRDGQALRYENFIMVDLLVIPIDEQRRIADYLNDQDELTHHLIKLDLNQIEKLKEYKTTLINSAVTGKIKIQGHGYDA